MESVNHAPSTQGELGEMINELQGGLDSASYLEVLLQDRSGSNAEILIQEIKSCFSRAITTLNSSNLSNEYVNQLQLPYANSQSISIQSNPIRRNRPWVEPYSKEKFILENPDDCYAWRKHSQKQIHSSKYPRFHFVCTHKEDLNCCATKTVQRLEGDPSMYEIIYCGQHTCMQLPDEQDFQNSKPNINFNSKSTFASSSDA